MYLMLIHLKMNILIVDHLGIYRFGLKAIINDIKIDAMVQEASNFDELMENVFDKNFDLLILDIEMQGNEKLEHFIDQAINYTKIIILSEHQYTDQRVNHFLKSGVDALISKSTSKEQVVNTLEFIFS